MTTYTSVVEVQGTPGGNDVSIQGDCPMIAMKETGAGTNAKWWDQYTYPDNHLYWRFVDDAYANATAFFDLCRSGMTVTYMDLLAKAIFGGTLLGTGVQAASNGPARIQNSAASRYYADILPGSAGVLKAYDSTGAVYLPYNIASGSLTELPSAGTGGFVSDGNGLDVTGALTTTDWGTFTGFSATSGSWLTANGAGWRKRGDYVEFKGKVTFDTTWSDKLGTVPSGNYPTYEKRIPCFYVNTTTGLPEAGYIKVTTAGNVYIVTQGAVHATTVYLDAVRYSTLS